MCNMIRTVVFLLFANCCVNVSRSEDNLLDAYDSLMLMLPMHCTCNLTDNQPLLAKIEEIRIRLSNEDSERSDRCDKQSHVNDGSARELTTTASTTDGTTPSTAKEPTTTTTTRTTTTTQTPIITTTTKKPIITTTRSTKSICDQTAMQWSSSGSITGKHCVQIIEIADPHTWTDNYLCFNRDYGVRWSSNQPIPGMKCTKIHEVADPFTWDDNYLCVPTTSTFAFHFSSAGAAANLCCIQMNEPADPHSWDDNYLCLYPV